MFYTPSREKPTAVTKRLVWVVDDSPLDAERTARVLGTECHVEVFRDGSAALERLATATATPDVLVLDWVMPGVSGVDVCRFLRSSPGAHASVGILLLTTHRHTEQIVEGLSAGANDYLAKPYADAELLARVRALLRSRQLLERAEEAEALSFKLLQMAPDPLIALDEQRHIKFVNESARAALQQLGPLQLGRPLAELLPDLDQALSARSARDTLLLPDTRVGDRLFSATLRQLPASNLFRTILSLRDVTESRRLDARRLDLYSIIAHDLRSPLSSIGLRTQLILEGRHGSLPGTLEQDMQKIDDHLKGLVGMINDFLELASLDSVRYELKRDKVDVAALITETVDDLRPLLEARSLQYVAQIETSTKVLGDVRRLQQVLTNLIGNAVKFTGARGKITTRVRHDAGEVEISIYDTGRGIPAESLPTIFERYTRAVETHDRTPGTGLGLMIVREIVEAHGGRVGVESTLGTGSRFWFRLPAAPL